MPIFRLSIEKYSALAAEYWVNRYFLQAATLADAMLMVDGIKDAERTLYYPGVVITKSHVDDNQPESEVYGTLVHNQAGQRQPETEPYPLFAVARVDFTVAGGGRPSRKYLRGVLTESDANGLVLGAGVLAVLQTYATNVAASGVCDPQGQDVISGSPWLAVAMRQLRRGSKKKVIPSPPGTP